MKISADIIEKDIRRDEGSSGELMVKFKPKHWKYVLPFPDTSTNWNSIKHEVLKKCGLSPESQVSVCYIDEENDKVRIDSEAEYHEALRVGQKCGNKLKIVVKELGTEEASTIQHSSGETFSYRELESGEFVVMDKLPSTQAESETVTDQPMVQKEPAGEHSDLNQKEESSVPSWLTSYSVQLKNELVKEISENVFERVMLMLGNASLTSAAEPEQKPVFVRETERNDDTLHVGIICDNCETPIRGIRYKCGNCTDYDLCEQCESLPHVHNETHSFLKIRHNVYSQVHGLITSVENTIPKHSPSRRSSHAVKTTVIRNTLGLKNRKEEKLMKVMRKIEKYRAKEQSSNCSRSVPTVIWQQTHLDRQVDSRKGESSSVSTSRCPSHDAEFIKDETFPDGIIVAPGLKFCKSWRMRNTGSKPFTSDTVLKYSWGGKKLVPESREVAVPSLLPGQEGIISVLFTAPTEPGCYTSHWRLSHRGIGFGDPVWCIVQIRETLPTDKKVELSGSQESTVETSEKCTVKQQSNVQEGIAQVLTAVQEEQQRGDSVERKVAILSHTATPTNTPFDLSPPKSPEPPETTDYLRETKVTGGKEDSAATCPESQSAHAENYTTGSESDDTISVINLNSSESDTEFVVVPMPMPLYCNMDVPLVPNSLQQDEQRTSISNLPEASSAPSTRRASVERVLTPSSLPSICICTGKESNATTSLASTNSSTPEEIGTAEGTSSSDSAEQQNLIQLDQITSTLEKQEDMPHSTEAQSTVVDNNSHGTERETESSCQSDGNTAEACNTTNENADNEERMVQVLPEGLVNGALTAAASVYNTARAVLTGIQNRNEPWHEDWRHSQTYPPAPPPPPPPPSPMIQLIEMGFCNRALNHHLLVKHKGNVEEVVAELVANHDNEWYSHRHTTDTYYVNFD